MKTYLHLSAVALLATMSFTTVSCGDDDDNNNFVTCPTPDKVFTNGLPKEFDGETITTDSEGRVATITSEYRTVTFSYTPVSRATKYDMTMTVQDKGYTDEKQVFFIQLNEMGFIKNALEVYVEKGVEDPETDTWEFSYNADGQMTMMKRSEGDNEVTTMTYVNGDITKVSVKDDESTTADTYTISYTDNTVKTAIDNKGCIMMFDNVFNIDMDEMNVAYLAGLLGRATKHLPVKNLDDKDKGYYVFTWTLNGTQYPIELKSTYYEQNGQNHGGYDTYTFKW